jgi:hypothetical protein
MRENVIKAAFWSTREFVEIVLDVKDGKYSCGIEEPGDQSKENASEISLIN